MGLSRKYYDLFVKLKREKKIDLAKEALSRAILLRPKSYYYYELALIFRGDGQWWQSIDNFKKALELESTPKLSWRLAYIESLEKMNRFSKVIEIFREFKDKEFDSSSYLRYGYALKKENQITKAKEMFNRAIELDDKNNSQTLGIGIFYEKKGNWIDALAHYKSKAKDEPFNALLHYKTGLSYDRNFFWKDAELEIGHAIALDNGRAYFFNRLAFNYERQNKFQEASEAYFLVIAKEKNPRDEHYYRLGYSLFYSNQYKDACLAFLKMTSLPIDRENSLDILEDKVIKKGYQVVLKEVDSLVSNISYFTPHQEIEKLIKLTTQIRAWSLLENLYQKILDYDKNCSSNNYINLAYSQYRQKKYKESSKNFIEQRIIQKVHSLSEKKFETDKEFRVIATYCEYIKRENLKKNYILYQSRGEFIDSKLYKILLTLLDDERFKEYKHILVVDNTTILDEKIKKLKSVIYVPKDSNLYLKYLSSSNYLINDGLFPSYFIRQNGQKYLNLEQILENIDGKFNSKEYLVNKSKISQDFLQSTHIINCNKSLIKEYSLRGIYTGQLVLSNNSIEDTIEFFFFDNLSKYNPIKINNLKQSLLIYASFEPNGITSSLNNLLNAIDIDKYEITLIIDNNTLNGYEDRIIELSHKINILIHSGRMVVTVEEQWVRDKFNLYSRLESSEMKSIFKETFEREFKRIFGGYKFDNIIDFNGYRTFWSTLFAFGNSNHKAIYLHNDMYKEYTLRYPSLEKAFYLYKEFDSLISVSESVSKSNMKMLLERYNLDKSQFYFANNLIDFNRYIRLSEKNIDTTLYKNFLDDKRIKFINVGRLSPEKGQQKLIEAFVKVYKKNKNISLYIMGQGALEQTLLSQINKYNMENNIILLGHQINPYPFIKKSDCMVLSSFHEGQALVLLEALSLKIPCISTDIAGPRSVLEDGYGILCNDDIDSIKVAIEKFIDNNLEFKAFSSLEYNQNAIKMFNKNMRIKN
jgi:glycosyltransferase involved in cell wall biosynthesis/tetratricopeptide (TPR) repeat protein